MSNSPFIPIAAVGPRLVSRRLHAGWVAAALLLCAGTSQALEYGPFSLTGFIKSDVTRTNNVCSNCQVFPAEDKQRFWADEIRPGATYGADTSVVTLVQPYLGANFDLGGGFKLSGLLSQRWRDWQPDIPGYLYEANVAVSHEAYGRVTVGAMTTRGWALADYPYGSDVGLAEEWSSAGAGYGLLEYPSIRYTAPVLDVAGGDLVLELTYSAGNTDFKINKPQFWEFWADYRYGDLVLDFVGQYSKNGNPQAWGHGPFTGLTPFPADDDDLGSSNQSIMMLMGRYIIDSNWEVLGGVRANRWSGAYAVVTTPGGTVTSAQWNNMFNVDWDGSRNGVPNPGYSAPLDRLPGRPALPLGQVDLCRGPDLPGQGQHRQPVGTRAEQLGHHRHRRRHLRRRLGRQCLRPGGWGALWPAGPVADVHAHQLGLHRHRFPGDQGRQLGHAGLRLCVLEVAVVFMRTMERNRPRPVYPSLRIRARTQA